MPPCPLAACRFHVLHALRLTGCSPHSQCLSAGQCRHTFGRELSSPVACNKCAEALFRTCGTVSHGGRSSIPAQHSQSTSRVTKSSPPSCATTDSLQGTHHVAPVPVVRQLSVCCCPRLRAPRLRFGRVGRKALLTATPCCLYRGDGCKLRNKRDACASPTLKRPATHCHCGQPELRKSSAATASTAPAWSGAPRRTLP